MDFGLHAGTKLKAFKGEILMIPPQLDNVIDYHLFYFHLLCALILYPSYREPVGPNLLLAWRLDFLVERKVRSR